MTIRFSALLLASALLPLSAQALAWPDELKGNPADAAAIYAAQGSFSEEASRTMADGRVYKRKVEQKVEGDSLSRQEVVTAPDGKTASYTLKRSFDAATQRWTRSEEGAGFDGKRWSRSQTGEPELLVFGDAPKPVARTEVKAEEAGPAKPKPTGPKRREFR